MYYILIFSRPDKNPFFYWCLFAYKIGSFPEKKI